MVVIALISLYNAAMTIHDCVTITEAAELTGYNPEWIRRLCERGTVEARKTGRVWIIDRGSLQEYAADPPSPGPEPGTFPGKRPQDRRPPSPHDSPQDAS